MLLFLLIYFGVVWPVSAFITFGITNSISIDIHKKYLSDYPGLLQERWRETYKSDQYFSAAMGLAGPAAVVTGFIHQKAFEHRVGLDYTKPEAL